MSTYKCKCSFCGNTGEENRRPNEEKVKKCPKCRTYNWVTTKKIRKK